MAWGNSSSRWGRKPTSKRGSVVWTDKTGAKPAPFAKAIPRYNEPRAIDENNVQYLVPGTMWLSAMPLNPTTTAGAKFQALVYAWDNLSAMLKTNSMLIYAGEVRVEERERNGRIVSVTRHTFIAGDGRYIVNDFSFITPVT